jgi:hypothetical protein
MIRLWINYNELNRKDANDVTCHVIKIHDDIK